MIHQFDPIIYPTRIWISINPTYEEVSKMFYALTSNTERIEMSKDWFSPHTFRIASTTPVASKLDGYIGVLVRICKLRQVNTSTICHESVHCADFICEQFGITNGSFENGEAYAYLVGWIAECIEKVKLGKVISQYIKQANGKEN